jgi:hypothetical protein
MSGFAVFWLNLSFQYVCVVFSSTLESPLLGDLGVLKVVDCRIV